MHSLQRFSTSAERTTPLLFAVNLPSATYTVMGLNAFWPGSQYPNIDCNVRHKLVKEEDHGAWEDLQIDLERYNKSEAEVLGPGQRV